MSEHAIRIFGTSLVFSAVIAALTACGGGGEASDTGVVAPPVTETPITETPASRFLKIDNSGNRLADNSDDWSCVQDRASGLMWEVKNDDGGLRDKDWVYTGYESTGENGNGVCDATKSCNQSYFKDAVNAVGLCGYRDWRLATVTELESLQDSSRSVAPFINTQYFPFTVSGRYWATNANLNIWWVDFSEIDSGLTRFKDIQHHVRLVRP